MTEQTSNIVPTLQDQNNTSFYIYAYGVSFLPTPMVESISKKKNPRAAPKRSTQICAAKNKNGKPCRCKSLHTIYCRKHTPCAEPKVILIQKWWRKKRLNNELLRRGPAYERRDVCNNLEDFYTYVDIKDIPQKYFISYHEKQTQKIWGFDIRSLSSLLQSRSTHNPYTTLEFDKSFINNVCHYIERLKHLPDFTIKDEEPSYSDPEERIRKECFNCFLEINTMGYHVDHNWLMNLTRSRLVKLFHEFQDIIMYRSNLSRQQIQDMFGLPFPFAEVIYGGVEHRSHIELVEIITQKLKQLLSINSDNKELGVLLFLTALTTVSPEALASLCFLQQNFFS